MAFFDAVASRGLGRTFVNLFKHFLLRNLANFALS